MIVLFANKTALIEAIEMNNIEIVKLLLEIDNIDITYKMIKDQYHFHKILKFIL